MKLKKNIKQNDLKKITKLIDETCYLSYEIDIT
jgi:hypothetical protein